MTTGELTAGNRLEITRKVRIRGKSPIMFDRYPGDNDTKLSVEQKVYLDPKDGVTLVLPALNVWSFLSAENTPSAPKVLLDCRKYKKIARACLNYVSIDEMHIPFLKGDEPIKLGTIENDYDKLSGIWVHRCVARLEKGIPNPKVRPVLPTPWALEFNLTIQKNNAVQEAMVKWLFEEGGRSIGFGTFRGVFGKFEVESWK